MEGDYEDLLAQLFPGMPISEPLEPYNFKQYLERRIYSLTALEAITCRLRFGLLDGKSHLTDEIAGMMNL